LIVSRYLGGGVMS